MWSVLAQESGGQSSALGSLLPLLLIGGLVYFLMIRPQRKKQAEFQAMQKTLSVGDDVITIGGLHGHVVSMGEQSVDLSVDADEDIVLRFRRSAIQEILRDDAEVPDAVEADE